MTTTYLQSPAQGHDLSLSRYRESVFEEEEHEAPAAILDRLIKAELGDAGENVRHGVLGGIAGELLELRRMVG